MARRWWRFVGVVAISLLVLIPMRAQAVLVAIDLDPGVSGVQSALSVDAGTSFAIDILISDAIGVNSFSLSLDATSSFLTPISVSSGGLFTGLPFIAGPANGIVGNDVLFVEFVLGPLSVSGDGFLAHVEFSVAGAAAPLSASDLSLSVLLADQSASPIALPAPTDVRISISAGNVATPVPAPATLLLLCLGLGLIGVNLPRRQVRAQQA